MQPAWIVRQIEKRLLTGLREPNVFMGAVYDVMVVGVAAFAENHDSLAANASPLNAGRNPPSSDFKVGLISLDILMKFV